VASTQEARVEVLEVKVQTLEEKVENLETNAGPGRADAQSGNLAELRRQFAEFAEVQAKQSQSLDIVTGKFNGLKEASTDYAFKLVVLDSGVRQLKDEVSGKFARLDNDVAGLKGDFAWLRGQFNDGGLLVGLSQDMMKLRDDVTGIEVKVDTLQDDVTVLKADVSELKTDVSELKSDVSELKTDVSELKSDVSELKSDVSELKTDMADVKGSLKEILDRLPAKAA
jgi:outer membrane murein-binding lipoprotein Lpp